MARKKRFYPVAITLFISQEMKSILNTIPNASLFIREAIQEKVNKEVTEIKEGEMVWFLR